MIKTYGDAIQFCESYPYTMEYFQLMKEAAQADLMGQMLLGQSYIQEKQSAGLFEEAARVVDNTFVEAMSDDDYLDLLIQYNESVGDVLRGIGHRLSTIFDSFLGLLRRARDFIKRHNPFRRNRGSGKSFTTDVPPEDYLDADTMVGISDTIEVDERDFEVTPGDNSAQRVKDRFEEEDTIPDGIDSKVRIKLHRISSHVAAHFSKSARVKNKKGIISDFGIVMELSSAISQRNVSKADMLYKKLMSAAKEPALIPNDAGGIESIIQILENASKDLKNSLDQLNNEVPDSGSPDTSNKDLLSIANGFMQLLGNTLTVYTKYLNEHQKVITKVETAAAKKQANTSKESKKTEQETKTIEYTEQEQQMLAFADAFVNYCKAVNGKDGPYIFMKDNMSKAKAGDNVVDNLLAAIPDDAIKTRMTKAISENNSSTANLLSIQLLRRLSKSKKESENPMKSILDKTSIQEKANPKSLQSIIEVYAKNASKIHS